MNRAFALTLLLLAAIASAGEQPTLKEAFQHHFLIGAALTEAQFSGQEPAKTELIRRQFNTATPEDDLKWRVIHPQPGEFNFGPADRFVAFCETNGLFPIGHTLVWHHGNPAWVFQDAEGRPADRETALRHMREHIHAVVGRYRGRIKGWDVVNEALDERGGLRRSPWLECIGEDYIEKAFQFAHEADPGAELYYNDYALENEPKRNGAAALIRKLQAKGGNVSGIGTQQHVRLDWPTVAQVDATLSAFNRLGVQVMITELDVDVLPAATNSQAADVSMNIAPQAALNPYTNGLPDAVQQALARRYAELFAVYLKHRDAIGRITFWGVTDGDSWRNHWPVRGRTSYPLLFDRNGLPKPAFTAVVEVAGSFPEQDVLAPLDPDAIARAREWGTLNREAATRKALRAPIEFFGKAEDDNGNAIAGATVAYSADDHIDPWNYSGTKGSTMTDNQGLFSFKTQGRGVYVSVSKEGYYRTPEMEGRRGSGDSFENPRALGKMAKPLPTKDAPAVFRLKKKGEPVALIHIPHWSFCPAKDGTPECVDLTTNRLVSSGPRTLSVQVWTQDQATNAAGRYDWKCRLSLPGGGLMPRNGRFDFEAPAEGYEPAIEVSMSADFEKWRPGFQREYFAKLPDARFGRFTIDLATRGSHSILLESFVNPTPGSRNLEFNYPDDTPGP